MSSRAVVIFWLGSLVAGFAILVTQRIYYRAQGEDFHRPGFSRYWHWLTKRQPSRKLEIERWSVWVAWLLAGVWTFVLVSLVQRV